MGQRLNIEIKIGGKVQANAYYHWSGYTSSAAQLTHVILTDYPNISENNDLIKAIRILETTQAGLTLQERARANKLFPDVGFLQCGGRNDGLIAFSPEDMKETRAWEEGRVTIDFDCKLVKFNVWWTHTIEEYKEEYGEELPEVSKRSLLVFSFDDFNDFFANTENCTTKCWQYKNKVYMPIY